MPSEMINTPDAICSYPSKECFISVNANNDVVKTLKDDTPINERVTFQMERQFQENCTEEQAKHVPKVKSFLAPNSYIMEYIPYNTLLHEAYLGVLKEEDLLLAIDVYHTVFAQYELDSSIEFCSKAKIKALKQLYNATTEQLYKGYMRWSLQQIISACDTNIVTPSLMSKLNSIIDEGVASLRTEFSQRLKDSIVETSKNGYLIDCSKMPQNLLYRYTQKGHNDFHLGNIIVTPDKHVYFLDTASGIQLSIPWSLTFDTYYDMLHLYGDLSYRVPWMISGFSDKYLESVKKLFQNKYHYRLDILAKLSIVDSVSRVCLHVSDDEAKSYFKFLISIAKELI